MQKKVELKNRYLLLIGCSERKFQDKGKIKAWDRYDGVVFRLLKKFDRENGLPDKLDIYILSALYGLIRPEFPISYYDNKITKSKAISQVTKNNFFLKNLLLVNHYGETFVCLGKNYLLAVSPIDTWLPDTSSLTIAKGGIGQKMACLKRWLNNLD